MTIILNELPYFAEANHVSVGNEYVPTLPHQIIIWVSLSARGPHRPLSPRFPAILDTGDTFGFTLSERRLTGWTGFDLRVADPLGTVRINQFRVPRYALDVWIYRNRKGQRDVFRPGPPHRLELRDGVAVYPLAAQVRPPRLPLLGL